MTKNKVRGMNDLMDEMTEFLIQSYSRVQDEEKVHPKRSALPMFTNAYAAVRSQCVNFTSLVIRGVFETTDDASLPKLPHSPLMKPYFDGKMPGVFLLDLAAEAWSDSEATFQETFAPFVQCLVAEVRSASIVDAAYTPSIKALMDLCDIKLAGNLRPICTMMTKMSEWLPDEVAQGCGGRELKAVSLLGPFLAVTVFAEEDPTVAEKFFPGKQSQATVRSLTGSLQRELELLRVTLHKIIHAIVANPSSRDAGLVYIQEVLERNVKRQQIQVEERAVAGDGFMLNFLTVMQKLSEKIRMEKVDQFYIHSEKSRVNISEDTRLNMTSSEAKEWLEGHEWKESYGFPTECWHLTLYAHHLSVMPCIRKYQRRLRAIRELHKMIEELEKTETAWRNHPTAGRNRALLKKWKSQAKKLNKSKACADIGLLDTNLFQRCFAFYSTVTEYLFMALAEGQKRKKAASSKEGSPEKSNSDAGQVAGPSTSSSDEAMASVAEAAPQATTTDTTSSSSSSFLSTTSIGGITIQFPMPAEAGDMFSALPEWIIEDVADFTLFSLQ